MSHYNWSHIDEAAMKRENPEKYRRWRLVQIINSDAVDEKLDRDEVIALWPVIKDEIDPWTRRAIEYLIWRTQYSLPDNLSWWNKPQGAKRSLSGTI